MKSGGKSRTTDREPRQRSTAGRADALTEVLQDRRRCVQDELDSLFRRLREEDRPETGDEGDWAVYGFDRELGSSRLDQLTQMLRQIDDALDRHAAGRYRRCVACDAEIPVARLRSLPFALYCRDCQEAAEKEQSRAGLVGPIA